MLKTLTVTNFALIEKVVVEFTDGLNILTGETGAGKSILVDALNIILGSRASAELIRGDSEFFRVEAVFDIAKLPQLHAFLEELAIELEDGMIIISRRLTRNGKNTISVNGCHITLAVLRQIGEKLVDMHGQHENQTLLHPGSYLCFLDSCNNLLRDKLGLYRSVHQQWLETTKKLAASDKMSKEREQRIDMLKWQIQDIISAKLVEREDEQLEQQIQILGNAEKIDVAVKKAYILLSQGHKGLGGVLSALSEVKREMELVARYDPRMQQQTNSIADALYQLEETAMEIRHYAEGFEYDPAHLVSVQERMDVIHKLKRKYGDTIEEILVFYQQAVAELAEISDADIQLVQLSKEKEAMESELTVLAQELDGLRQQAAKELSCQITQHLKELGMPNAQFVIEVKQIDEFGAYGRNAVDFLFSANLGESIRSLHKVASGGELSRIALAIKAVGVAKDEVGSMVFDEVDTGIGGKTAQMVAEKIAQVAAVKQVLCITHLPQLACMADTHMYIEKMSTMEKTITTIRNLDFKEQLTELARMIAGNDVTSIAMDNAAEMLRIAKKKKERWKKEA